MKPEDRYDSLFQFYAEAAGLDWLRLKAQVKAESNFDPDAESAVGAQGLAQFMAATWKEFEDGLPGIPYLPKHIRKLSDPRDPEDAIRAQAAMMQWLLKQWNGDYWKALASYNWGIGKVKKTVKQYKDSWEQHLPTETAEYLNRIESYYAEYKRE